MNDLPWRTEVTANRIDLSGNSDCILVMTVGTGDLAARRSFLCVPAELNRNHARTQMSLLPSQATEASVEILRSGERNAAVRSIPEGNENDEDRVYAHLDSVLAEAPRETPSESVAMDFTHGDKAMSVGLVLADARTPQLRCVAGRRDDRKIVMAVWKRPEEFGQPSAPVIDGSTWRVHCGRLVAADAERPAGRTATRRAQPPLSPNGKRRLSHR